MDISIGAVNGAAAVHYVSRQLAALPPLRPLTLVAKALLKEASLNEVFTGGLSSYVITLMAIAHLQAGAGVVNHKSAYMVAGDCAGALTWKRQK